MVKEGNKQTKAVKAATYRSKLELGNLFALPTKKPIFKECTRKVYKRAKAQGLEVYSECCETTRFVKNHSIGSNNDDDDEAEFDDSAEMTVHVIRYFVQHIGSHDTNIVSGKRSSKKTKFFHEQKWEHFHHRTKQPTYCYLGYESFK